VLACPSTIARLTVYRVTLQLLAMIDEIVDARAHDRGQGRGRGKGKGKVTGR
jgi:hypothetical protein